MTVSGNDIDGPKRRAALAALDLIEDDMLVGLGTGSTASWFVSELGAKLSAGALRSVSGVPTSVACRELAVRSGIPLMELPAQGVDVAVDGMDEVDGGLRAIKGLGGALAREKIVAASAGRFLLIGDSSKKVARLARKTPVPVEILEFGWRRTVVLLERLSLKAQLRVDDGEPVRSDNGNLIVDCGVSGNPSLEELAIDISQLPGVVEHGLFLDQAELAFIAHDDGVERLVRAS